MKFAPGAAKHIWLFPLALAGLGACTVEDDFGRYHQSELTKDSAEIVGSIQRRTGMISKQVAYHIPLTGDEHTLRQTYIHFKKPFLPNPGSRNLLGTQTFAQHKTAASFNAFMRKNIKTDRHWLRRLDRSLGGVIEQDTQRYAVLSNNYDITHNDSRYIRVRIRENRGLAVRLIKLLDRRLTIYDQAIDYARLHYRQRDLLPLASPLDALRAEIGLFKGRYEAYVFERGAKAEMYDYQHRDYR